MQGRGPLGGGSGLQTDQAGQVQKDFHCARSDFDGGLAEDEKVTLSGGGTGWSVMSVQELGSGQPTAGERKGFYALAVEAGTRRSQLSMFCLQKR